MLKLSEIKIKHIFSKSYIRCLTGGECYIDKSAKIRNSRIIIGANSRLFIEECVEIDDCCLYIENGSVHISKNSIIKGEKNHKVQIIVEYGMLSIGHHSKCSCRRIWIRFGGNCTIGDYTNINNESEIRCDKKISIGSYCQISYNVKIWDTNTHSIISKIERRERTENYFPFFGKELDCPKVSPIHIGDDCWIGENCAIFKGTYINDECILGYGTFVMESTIPYKSRAVSKNILKVDPL